MNPLNINLKEVDTSYPTLAVGDHRAKIESVEVKESANKPGLQMLNLKLETLEPASNAKDGAILDPGFKFSTNIVLPGGPAEATEKMTADEIQALRMKNLAMFVDAIAGSTQETRPDFNEAFVNSLPGKEIIVTFKKSKDTSYGETQASSFKYLAR